MICTLCQVTNKVKDDEVVGAYSSNVEKRNAYRLLVGKPEGKRPLGRPRRRWVDNIKVDLLEIGWGGVDWIGLAQERDENGDLLVDSQKILNKWKNCFSQLLLQN
jgi:hypothetical protein